VIRLSIQLSPIPKLQRRRISPSDNALWCLFDRARSTRESPSRRPRRAWRTICPYGAADAEHLEPPKKLEPPAAIQRAFLACEPEVLQHLDQAVSRTIVDDGKFTDDRVRSARTSSRASDTATRYRLLKIWIRYRWGNRVEPRNVETHMSQTSSCCKFRTQTSEPEFRSVQNAAQ